MCCEQLDWLFYRTVIEGSMNLKLNYLVIFGIVALVLGVGGAITRQGMEWYTNDLVLSPLTPPSWIFPVAWNIIGFCTALSLIITWNTFKRDFVWRLVLALFCINGILNVSWSYVFFIRHEIGKAYWIAAAIEATVLLLMLLVWNRSRAAALLLLPYAVWVLFALYLNNDIWLINEAL